MNGAFDCRRSIEFSFSLIKFNYFFHSIIGILAYFIRNHTYSSSIMLFFFNMLGLFQKVNSNLILSFDSV